MAMLRSAVVDTIDTDTDTDALGRLNARDRRDDLNRGQNVTASPAQLAAMSAPRATAFHPAPSARPDTERPAQIAGASRPERALAPRWPPS